MSAHSRQIHPHDVALSNALDEALNLAKGQGISASWVAEYVLKVSPGQLSKYRNPADPDMLPARAYPLIEQATGNAVLWDALEALRPGRDERHSRALSALASLLSRKSGNALCLLIQAMSPESPGGAEITAGEIAGCRTALLEMRVLLDELIDGTTNEKAGVRIPA